LCFGSVTLKDFPAPENYMPSQPKEGGSVPIFTAQDLDDSLNALFGGELNVETKEGVSDAVAAFINLGAVFKTSDN